MSLQGEGSTHERPEQGASGTLEQVRSRTRRRQVEMDQSVVLGLLAGAVAALIGAAAWAYITVTTNQVIGLVAAAIGLLVGFAVRIFGKGITPVFGVIGASLSLLGCLAGKLLASCMYISRKKSIPLADLLARLDPQAVIDLLASTYRPMDLVFYGIAVYIGYQYSFYRPSSENE